MSTATERLVPSKAFAMYLVILDSAEQAKLAQLHWQTEGLRGLGPTADLIAAVMREKFPNFIVPEDKGLFHCDVCEALHKQKKAVNNEQSRIEYETARTKHSNTWSLERRS